MFTGIAAKAIIDSQVVCISKDDDFVKSLYVPGSLPPQLTILQRMLKPLVYAAHDYPMRVIYPMYRKSLDFSCKV